MKNNNQKLKRQWFILITFILLCFLAYDWFDIYRTKKNIPEQIKVSKTLLIERAPAGCLDAAFEIDDKTLQQINEKGLSFFKKNPHSQHSGRWTDYYDNWRETPIPKEELSENSIPGGFCANGFNKEQLAQINKAAFSRGSYFTMNGTTRTLILIPSLKIIILTNFD